MVLFLCISIHWPAMEVTHFKNCGRTPKTRSFLFLFFESILFLRRKREALGLLYFDRSLIDKLAILIGFLLWQMKVEAENWPYDFVQSKEFPSSKQRGNISGRFLVHDRLLLSSLAYFILFYYYFFNASTSS